MANKLGPDDLPRESLVLDAYLDAKAFESDASLLQETYDLDRGLKHFVLKTALSQKIGKKDVSSSDLRTLVADGGVCKDLSPAPF